MQSLIIILLGWQMSAQATVAKIKKAHWSACKNPTHCYEVKSRQASITEFMPWAYTVSDLEFKIHNNGKEIVFLAERGRWHQGGNYWVVSKVTKTKGAARTSSFLFDATTFELETF